jgi:hypothetical protein
MTQILVVPHGGRWAVKCGPDATPLAEYETCELAEMAARGIAAKRGGEVVVDRDGAGRFDRPANVHTEDTERGQGTDPLSQRTGDTRGTEEARQAQAGL